MRCPPARNGTRPSAFCGALRIRSTPFGFERVRAHMPPGLTIGMKTSRIDAQLFAEQFVPFEAAQQRAHVVEDQLRADALQPVHAAEKADRGRFGVGRADASR